MLGTLTASRIIFIPGTINLVTGLLVLFARPARRAPAPERS